MQTTRLREDSRTIIRAAISASTTSSPKAVFDYVVEGHDASRAGRLADAGLYHFDATRGPWDHRSGPAEQPLRLTQVSYGPDREMLFPATAASGRTGV